MSLLRAASSRRKIRVDESLVNTGELLVFAGGILLNGNEDLSHPGNEWQRS